MSIPPHNGLTVLVTGINGYIASTIGVHLLSNGYNLRGTTRSSKSAAILLDGAYKDFASRVEIVEIPDMTIPRTFDEAVKGVHAIHHIASPMWSTLQVWNDCVPPALDGCKGLLGSALAHAGPQLESLVFSSSAAVLGDPRLQENRNKSEDDWKRFAESRRAALGQEAYSVVMYQASKTLAESMLWRFRDEHKVRCAKPPPILPQEWPLSTANAPPQPSFSICSTVLSVVTGPPVQPPSNASTLGTTLLPIWRIFSGEVACVPPAMVVNTYVDVRDVAAVHLWCMAHPTQSDGQRYIVSAGLGPPQAAADILRKAYPGREGVIPKGEPGRGYLPDFGFAREGERCSGTKAVEAISGLRYIRYDESILDTAKVMERYLET